MVKYFIRHKQGTPTTVFLYRNQTLYCNFHEFSVFSVIRSAGIVVVVAAVCLIRRNNDWLPTYLGITIIINDDQLIGGIHDKYAALRSGKHLMYIIQKIITRLRF